MIQIAPYCKQLRTISRISIALSTECPYGVDESALRWYWSYFIFNIYVLQIVMRSCLFFIFVVWKGMYVCELKMLFIIFSLGCSGVSFLLFGKECLCVVHSCGWLRVLSRLHRASSLVWCPRCLRYVNLKKKMLFIWVVQVFERLSLLLSKLCWSPVCQLLNPPCYHHHSHHLFPLLNPTYHTETIMVMLCFLFWHLSTLLFCFVMTYCDSFVRAVWFCFICVLVLVAVLLAMIYDSLLFIITQALQEPLKLQRLCTLLTTNFAIIITVAYML
jgi:hypothetical protein